MKRSIAALSMVLLLLGACAGGDPDPAPTTTTATTSTGVTTVPSAGPGSSPSASVPGSTAPSADCAPIAGGGETYLQLTDVRVGKNPGFDRVVFQFAPSTSQSPPVSAPAGVLPKYDLKRVGSIVEDGSGEPVDIAGKDLFQIVFHGASGVDLFGEQPVQTYKGPKEFKPNFPVLRELQRSGDFEATLSWGLGLQEPRCPVVTELTDPLRLAIDFPH